MADTEIRLLAKLEGLTFEEAKLAHKQRKSLPATSFCGPSRSFPCHDITCVRESFDKVNKEQPENWHKIAECIKERAERFGVRFVESKANKSKLIEWYLNKYKPEKECEECEEE